MLAAKQENVNGIWVKSINNLYTYIHMYIYEKKQQQQQLQSKMEKKEI